jgi:DNA-binding LytR/AlgR family response regulator
MDGIGSGYQEILVKNLHSVYHSVWKVTADAVLLPAVWTRFSFGVGYLIGGVLDTRAEHIPLTVFVTAYDEHAIRAFKADALDYLLKPFSDERWTPAGLGLKKCRCPEPRLWSACDSRKWLGAELE